MADYRRHFDEGPRRQNRDGQDRTVDEGRPWSDDRNSRYETDHHGDWDDRTSRWEGPQDDRPFGTYRTDDRDYHDRYRTERLDRGTRAAANDYYRAARDQRDDYLRWSANNMGTWGEQHLPDEEDSPPPGRRERGGYWRRYETTRPNFQGRGPKGYQRNDDRIREEVCDCMTDDSMLDASDIEVVVVQGEVTLTGSVTDREQKRRAEDVACRISGVKDVTNQLRVSRDTNGHKTASSQPVTQASGKGTPGKSSRTTA